jgi:AI-2 transport protein TqsA
MVTDGQAVIGVGPVIPRGLAVLLGLAAAVVVAAGVRSLAWLIGPTFLALIIVIALAPVHARLRARGWPGWSATLVLASAVYATVLALAFAVLISLARLATALPEYAPRGTDVAGSVTSLLQRFGVGPEELRRVIESLDLGKIAQVIGGLLSQVAGLASNLVFILMLLLFLSVETSTVRERIAIIAADRPTVADALAGFARNTRQYLVVSTVFGLIVAALDTVALALMGIPLAITWGVLSFVTNYIPNVGFLIGLIPPAVLGLLVGGPQTFVAVIVVYSVLNFVVQSLIQPRYVGDAVGLSATVTFLSLVFWSWLLGPLGAILAIPLTLLAKALLVDIDPRARWADAFLREASASGGRAAPADAPGPRRSRWRRRRPEEVAAP